MGIAQLAQYLKTSPNMSRQKNLNKIVTSKIKNVFLNILRIQNLYPEPPSLPAFILHIVRGHDRRSPSTNHLCSYLVL
jgi:hypothetical protein